MAKRFIFVACQCLLCAAICVAAKYDAEKQISVNGKTRKYILYVPNNVADNAPLVFSLHGAAGHDTDRSPFRTSVADQKGCIVVYPQGADQYFPIFGGSVPGWNASGWANEDTDFFKAIIDEVGSLYSIDRNRIYCCGFSNGGMMTYANTSAASDIFAAFASISGFQLNEFHQRTIGERPVPMLHIHGKADDFVKYSCTPIIRDNMVARNGCNPVPEVQTVANKYTKSVYKAGEGGFEYVFYEVDGMGHNDYTGNTEDGNSALTMWNFMSRYTLSDDCDPSLKWRLNIDAEGFVPRQHNWKVNADGTRFSYGVAKKPNNLDNNVYPSVQFDAGNYILNLSTEGDGSRRVYVMVEGLDDGALLFSKAAYVGNNAVIPFSVPEYKEFKITIAKDSPDDKFTALEIHSCVELPTAENCEDSALPDDNGGTSKGYLIEIPQDQGKQYDNFTRTACQSFDGYTQYTATGDLQIAFKMMDIDVTDCDYVVVKFAEPVESGWKLAFWEGTDLTDVAPGTTEYIFELEQSMINSGRLPQICMMTFFGGYTAPLIAKVTGVYKHCILDDPGYISNQAIGLSTPVSYHSLTGLSSTNPFKGINIVRMSDGTTRKQAF